MLRKIEFLYLFEGFYMLLKKSFLIKKAKKTMKNTNLAAIGHDNEYNSLKSIFFHGKKEYKTSLGEFGIF